jgi:hypothetical protein
MLAPPIANPVSKRLVIDVMQGCKLRCAHPTAFKLIQNGLALLGASDYATAMIDLVGFEYG